MNKILLTGANGFLGSIIYQILKDEFKFFSVGRQNVDIICDLRINRLVIIEPIDLVIHSAGKAHTIPKTEFKKNDFFETNVTGTLNLLRGLELAELPKQFVYISSVAVYGRESGFKIDENFPLLATDPYGRSKIEAEEIVTEWCKKNNVICTILRLPLLVGENPRGNLGAMLKSIDKGFYFNIDGGKARKSMVLAKDVAAIIPKVAAVGGIFNLTDGIHPDFRELSITISKQKKKKIPLNLPLFITKFMGYIGDIFGNKAPINSSKIKKITSHLTFDDSKARKLLDWNPQSVLEYLKNNSL